MPMGEQVADILLPFKQYTDRVLKSVHASRHHLCVGGRHKLFFVYYSCCHDVTEGNLIDIMMTITFHALLLSSSSITST